MQAPAATRAGYGMADSCCRKRESRAHNKDAPDAEDDIDSEEHFLSLDDCLEGQHGSGMASSDSDMLAKEKRALPPQLYIPADTLAVVRSEQH